MIQDKLDAAKNKDDEEIKSGDIVGSGKRTPLSCSNSPFRRAPIKSGSAEDVGQRDGENTKVMYSLPLERMTTPPLAPDTPEESIPVLIPVSESCENTPESILSTTPYTMKEPRGYPTQLPYGGEKTFTQDSFPENSMESFQPSNINQASQMPGCGCRMSSHLSPRSVPHMESVDPLMVLDRKFLGNSDGLAPALPMLSTDFDSSAFPRKSAPVFSPSSQKNRNTRVLRGEQRQYGGQFRQLWTPSSNSAALSPPSVHTHQPHQSAPPTHSPYSSSRQFSRDHHGSHGVHSRNHYHQAPVHVASHGHSSTANAYHGGGFASRGTSRGDSSGSSGGFEFQRGRPSNSTPSNRSGRSPPPYRGNNPGHHGQGTPPGHHQQHFHSPASTTGTNSSARTAPEILKTLLRKKACLYEAGTSRAIALITWLVGRELAIRTGYFTRQELQYGVHQVVSVVIESGGITRTKVNRCMQIILNSCFHYIIPRPDGVESGERFRRVFSDSATDDSLLLQGLPSPWDNIDIEGALTGLVIPEDDQSHGEDSASSGGATTGRSPPGRRGDSVPSAATHEQDLQDQDSEEGVGQGLGGTGNKRVVLLCFNENVRSYEDVYRCHNEFIRDVANAGNLELTFDDWKHFFAGAGSTAVGPQKRNSPSPSSSPQSKLGPSQLLQQSIPEMSLDETVDERHGTMTRTELLTFRTSWCCKRYDHNPLLCGFAHVDVNDGWLRRNPQGNGYKDEMCPNITLVKGSGGSNLKSGIFVNTCPKGVACEFAHSREEIEYHPNRYKKFICPTISTAAENTTSEGSSGRYQKLHHSQKHCERRSVCPFIHSKRQNQQQQQQQQQRSGGSGGGVQSNRMDASPSHHTPRHHRHRAPEGHTSLSGGFSDKSSSIPLGSPMMYIGPAPESEFEKSLLFPGLRALFRRQCAVLHACSQGGGEGGGQDNFCKYEMFGDGV